MSAATDKEFQELHRWDIPEDWSWVRISDVGEISTGNTPSKKDPSNYGDYLPLVKPPELRNLPIRTAPDGLTKKGMSNARILPEGAVLVSCIGALGKVGLAKVPVAFNQQINAIVFDERVVPEYGYYYAQTLKPWLYSVSSATTLPIVNKGKFRKAPFPLAPKDQQGRIVAEIEKQFSRLDEAVASLKRVKANLKRYKAAVLKAAVEGKLTEEWRKQNPEVEPASKLLDRILAERRAKWEEAELAKIKAKGRMPKDDNWKVTYKEALMPRVSELSVSVPPTWTTASIDQISNEKLIGLVRGKAAQNTGGNGVPYIKMNNVTTDGQVTDEDLVFVNVDSAELRRYELKAGDILFNTRNSQELVGKTGLVRVLPEQSVFNNNLMRIRIADGICPEFLAEQMCAKPFRDQLEVIKRATTNVAAIYGKDLFPLTLFIPPALEQKQIAFETDRLVSLLTATELNLQYLQKKAARLRQSILKVAFEAKLQREPTEGNHAI